MLLRGTSITALAVLALSLPVAGAEAKTAEPVLRKGKVTLKQSGRTVTAKVTKKTVVKCSDSDGVRLKDCRKRLQDGAVVVSGKAAKGIWKTLTLEDVDSDTIQSDDDTAAGEGAGIVATGDPAIDAAIAALIQEKLAAGN